MPNNTFQLNELRATNKLIHIVVQMVLALLFNCEAITICFIFNCYLSTITRSNIMPIGFRARASKHMVRIPNNTGQIDIKIYKTTQFSAFPNTWGIKITHYKDVQIETPNAERLDEETIHCEDSVVAMDWIKYKFREYKYFNFYTPFVKGLINNLLLQIEETNTTSGFHYKSNKP